jgi:hypothetical protein
VIVRHGVSKAERIEKLPLSRVEPSLRASAENRPADTESPLNANLNRLLQQNLPQADLQAIRRLDRPLHDRLTFVQGPVNPVIKLVAG